MYEGSGSLLYPGILTETDTIEESRMFMISLTIFRVKWILCNFGLVPWGNQVTDTWVIRIGVLGGVSAGNSALPDVEDKTSGASNRAAMEDIPLWRILLTFYQE